MVLSTKTLAAFAVTSLLTQLASAAESPLELSWQAPAPCPSEGAFRSRIQGLTRAPAAGEVLPTVHASVRITQLGSGSWQARVSTRGQAGTGERVVSDARCEDVSRAVALILAFALSPVEASQSPRSDRPPVKHDISRRPTANLGLDFVLSTGSLPKLGLAAQGRLGVELRPVLLELRVLGFLPQSEAISGAGRARAALTAAELALTACYSADLAPPFAVQGCGGVEVSRLSAASSGVTEPGRATGVWATPFLEAALRVALSNSPFGLRFAAQAGRALAAPRFAVVGDGVFFRPEPYTFRLAVGGELHF